MTGIWQYTLYCPHCGAVVKLAPTNANARLNAICEGTDTPKAPSEWTGPVTGDHAPTEMRQIGGRWL